jgi:NAD(P)-dependent dehydrogenase (short-subunit alcohol dehydrogenase family)
MTRTSVDDDGFTGKTAIITGGGAAGDGVGNGRAACILLARRGVRVLVVDRQFALAETTVKMIVGEGGEAVALETDVTDEAGCKTMVDAALGHFGRLDFLVNNDGIGSKGAVTEESTADWQRVLRVNLDSMFLSSKYAIPAIVKTAGGGALVNISSISALRPRGMTSYATTKGAVISLTRAMAVDHGRDHIRVNCVLPGAVYTPLSYGSGMSAAAREQRRKASVLGIEGTGWDVGQAVRFMLSEQACFITGQVLVVDGCMTLVGPSRDHNS